MNKGQWGKIRAFFDLQTEDGFIIKGFKLVEGSNGFFVGFPSQKGQDGAYYDTVYAEKELKEKVTKLAMTEFGGDIMSGGYSPSNNFPQGPSGSGPEKDTAPFEDDDIPF